MAHRVRTLIPYLEYGVLSKQKLIPKERLFTAKLVPSRGGKTPCPTLAKKLGPSQYGLFVERIVETLLASDCNIQSLESAQSSLPDNLQRYFKSHEWQPLANLLKSEFLDKGIVTQPQVELSDSEHDIAGHPDLMSVDTIYDIKTTGRFAAMRTSTIFQLLSYYCLAQRNKLPITKIGLVLPLQLSVVTYDLHKSGWMWKPYYDKLIATIDCKLEKQTLWNLDPIELCLFYANVRIQVGFHCHIQNLHAHIKENIPTLQFFLGGNANAKIKYTDKFVTETKRLVSASTSKVFIHSPYVLNLSHPGSGDREGDDVLRKELGDAAWGGWTFNCLKKIFDFAVEANIRGVVIHCGKRCGKNYFESVFNMWCSIIACARWATPTCKLLIETSSGQGGEILCTPSELGNFYLSLPKETRSNTGICVDTCHVFAAGYEPFDYIKKLSEMGVPIDLIHYNDSEVKCGEFKDRHAPIGRGYIGYESLAAISDYAIIEGIPMVQE